MDNPSGYLEALIREFSRLPGIGPKSASRIAFYILSLSDDDVKSFASTVIDVKRNIKKCSLCGGISEGVVCHICSNSKRKNGLMCVVEHQKDILTIESTGTFSGLYHVLDGLISPLDGIGPEDIRINELVDRSSKVEVSEVILALNPTVEGDATSLYIIRLFSERGIVVSRIAHGLPVGSDIEFADHATISKSIEGRRVVK
jgi:recombination protein RecR